MTRSAAVEGWQERKGGRDAAEASAPYPGIGMKRPSKGVVSRFNDIGGDSATAAAGDTSTIRRPRQFASESCNPAKVKDSLLSPVTGARLLLMRVSTNNYALMMIVIGSHAYKQHLVILIRALYYRSTLSIHTAKNCMSSTGYNVSLNQERCFPHSHLYHKHKNTTCKRETPL